jgi:hypothetical protein
MNVLLVVGLSLGACPFLLCQLNPFGSCYHEFSVLTAFPWRLLLGKKGWEGRRQGWPARFAAFPPNVRLTKAFCRGRLPLANIGPDSNLLSNRTRGVGHHLNTAPVNWSNRVGPTALVKTSSSWSFPATHSSAIVPFRKSSLM